MSDDKHVVSTTAHAALVVRDHIGAKAGELGPHMDKYVAVQTAIKKVIGSFLTEQAELLRKKGEFDRRYKSDIAVLKGKKGRLALEKKRLGKDSDDTPEQKTRRAQIEEELSSIEEEEKLLGDILSGDVAEIQARLSEMAESLKSVPVQVEFSKSDFDWLDAWIREHSAFFATQVMMMEGKEFKRTIDDKVVETLYGFIGAIPTEEDLKLPTEDGGGIAVPSETEDSSQDTNPSEGEPNPPTEQTAQSDQSH